MTDDDTDRVLRRHGLDPAAWKGEAREVHHLRCDDHGDFWSEAGEPCPACHEAST